MSGERDRALADAYAVCERIARRHYENFPVASWVLPAGIRRHVAAVYAFARMADDIADEPGLDSATRLRLLSDLCPPEGPLSPRGGTEVLPGDRGQILAALVDTREKFDLPWQLFEDLLSAFRQDVTTARYETWTELLNYCRRSANPIGRIVLRLHGYRDVELDHASDSLCTALQLVNFWQDLAIDWSRGRLYVPADTWHRARADMADLDRRQWTPAWQTALKECGAHTRAHFRRGRLVCDGVHGRLRLQLRATWLGGSNILDQLDRAKYDVFAHRPTLTTRDRLVIALEALFWRSAPPV